MSRKQLIYYLHDVCGNSTYITEYQRLTTYGFDPRDKPSDGYTKDKAYDLRITAYGFGNRIPEDNPY